MEELRVKFGILLAGIALCASAAADARLVRQNVVGAWRECIYQGRPQTGSASPRQPLGAMVERTIRIGRGEPCPATYPTPRRARPRPPASSDTPS
jgi:hypothetical protein